MKPRDLHTSNLPCALRAIPGKLCVYLIVVFLLAPSHISACDGTMWVEDSICTTTPANDNQSKFQYKQLILPAALVAVGSFGVCNGTFHRLNNYIRNEIAEVRGEKYFRADDYIQYIPIASYLGLGVVGVKCRHSFKERFVAGATAYLAMGIIVNSTKYAVGEKRPDCNARNSFPSGHTATVFMGAELIRHEYGPGISIGAYAIAAGVAFLRIYNDRHWLNDVIAGAGIGILSARIGYWMLPLYQKWFHWDNKSATITLMPNYNVGNRSFGIGLAAAF